MKLEDNAIKLEDNKFYYVTKEIEDNNTTYVYLTDLKDPMNFCVRKKDETKENLIGLSDEDEFKKAMELFVNKIN